MTDEKTVTITQTEYDGLLWSAKLLAALKDAGVDNWEWYGEATCHLYGDEE